MRYKRAVEKLRILAETCERVKIFWFDTEPFLKALYAFGEVLDGADPLDAVQVAVAINLPPEEVLWESSPAPSPSAGPSAGMAPRLATCPGRLGAHRGHPVADRACQRPIAVNAWPGLWGWRPMRCTLAGPGAMTIDPAGRREGPDCSVHRRSELAFQVR
jgi:hypothetical protein